MEAFDFAVGLGSVGAGAPWARAGVFECLEEVVGAVAGSVVGEDSFAQTMELLGARNWWLPGWLDRILPNLNVEGSAELSGAPDEE